MVICNVPSTGSYTTSLFGNGWGSRIAQKVGEEGVELALARMKDDKAEMASGAADAVVSSVGALEDADMQLDDVIAVLRTRYDEARNLFWYVDKWCDGCDPVVLAAV